MHAASQASNKTFLCFFKEFCNNGLKETAVTYLLCSARCESRSIYKTTSHSVFVHKKKPCFPSVTKKYSGFTISEKDITRLLRTKSIVYQI